MTEWRIERLSREHTRDGFDCGQPALDDFLRTLVSQYERRDLGRTYVAVAADDPRVLGYYTLAGGSIDVGGLPLKASRKLPRHPVPVVLIARLAVDRRVQRGGLGGRLLRDALTRSLEVSGQLGVHAVVVDALDAHASDFYKRFGFLELTDSPLRLFLPLSTVRAAAGGSA